LGNILRGNVGDEVSKFINLDGDPLDQVVAHLLGFGRGELGVVGDGVAELVHFHALGEPADNRREDISRVKGVGHGVQEVMVGSDVPHFDRFLALVDERQHAVVGRHELIFHGTHQDGAARRPYPGINHHQMNGVGRKIAITLHQGEGGVKHVVGIDVVAKINQFDLRIDIENNPFHHPHEVIRRSKIRGERDHLFARQVFPSVFDSATAKYPASYRKGAALSRLPHVGRKQTSIQSRCAGRFFGYDGPLSGRRGAADLLRARSSCENPSATI
jgi:hypothetical protein